DPQWAKQAIAEIQQKGIMLNDVRGFGGNRAVTRGEMAFALTKLFNLDYGDIRFIKAPQVSDYYTDVAANSPYAEAIMMCAINNIFESKDRQFKPMAKVTRIEAAIAINRCFQAKKIEVFTTMMFPMYDDTAKLTSEESAAMSFVSNSGMMQGDKKRFRLYSPMTRAEAACLFVKTGKVIEQCASQK
ncbi:MAG: S-layer homology domain-containing protein, partial [Candidatus Saccharibacteria bacterium]